LRQRHRAVRRRFQKTHERYMIPSRLIKHAKDLCGT
jgi:hypothetical protein